MIQRLISLTQDIGPDNSDEILYYLHNEENHIDLVKLYFEDPQSYKTLKHNLLQFAQNNKNVYNPEGDGLTDFIVNSLTTYGLLDNFLVDQTDLEINNQFLTNNLDLFKKIFNDGNNSAEVKIKFEGIYNYFLNQSIYDCTKDIKLIENKSLLIYLLMGEEKKYYETIFTKNLNEIVTSKEIGEYIKGIIISKLLIFKTGVFENFVINNLSNFQSNDNIFLLDRDFNLAAMIILSPFNIDRKNSMLSELAFTKLSFGELVKNNFDLKNTKNPNQVLSDLYNNGLEIYTKGISLSELNIASYENQYRFIKLNIDNLQNIESNFVLDLFYESINSNNQDLINKITNNIHKLEELKTSIQVDKFTNNFDKLDQIISNFKDNDFKKEFYKKIYTSSNYPLIITINTLDEKSLNEILEFNKDPEIEKKILDVLDKYKEDPEFNDLYISNLLKENNFEKSYMFPYSQIIKDLGKGKSDIDTISMIFTTPSFLKQNPVKVGDFIEYLISNQINKYSALKIIELFFEKKNSFSTEFFDIVFKNVIVTYLGKRNLVKEFIQQMNQQTDQILGTNKEPGFMDKIIGLFKPKSDMDKLRDVSKLEQSALTLDQKNKDLLKTQLDETNDILDFVNKYKSYFYQLDFDILINDLKISKVKLEKLL